MKNILAVSCMLIGSLVGAGFASGQEMMSYFLILPGKSVWYPVISVIIISLYTLFVLLKVSSENMQNGFFFSIMGRRGAAFSEVLMYTFSFASFCVMASGAGESINEMTGISSFTGSVLFLILCFFIFIFGAKGIAAVSVVLSPLMAAGIVAAAASAAMRECTDVFSHFEVFYPAASSVIYAGYNIITFAALAVSMKSYIKKRSDALKMCAVCSLAIGITALAVYVVLNMYMEDVQGSQMPMLYIASLSGNWMKWTYFAIVFAAMLTTAISSGYAVISKVSELLDIKGRTVISAVMCLLSTPLSMLGFSSLVGRLYAFFGIFGIFMMYAVICDGVRGEVLIRFKKWQKCEKTRVNSSNINIKCKNRQK